MERVMYSACPISVYLGKVKKPQAGKAPKIIHPQLIFGRNDFSKYCAAYFDHPRDDFRPFLPCLMGYTPSGKVVVHDFASDIIHLLISGQTGAGKTSGLYGLLFTMMWLNLPKWLRIDLYATKGIEMFRDLTNVYNDIDSMVKAALELPKRLQKRMEILRKNPRLYTIDLYNEFNKNTPLRYEIIVFDEITNILRALELTFRSRL